MKYLLRYKHTIIILILTVGAFLITKTAVVSIYALHLTLISLLVLIVYYYLLKKEKIKGRLRSNTITVFLVMAFVLLLVAATGWFFSPFFFSLYLLVIYLAFVFPRSASLCFVITLVILFSFNIGDVDLAYDFLVILSLLSTIPVSFYLRKEYLRLKEAEKDILILEEEQKEYRNKVEEVLANKVSRLGANLRQPINNVKQLGYRLQEVKGEDKQYQKIVNLSEEALQVLKRFEEETTGEKILTNPVGHSI